MALTSVAVLLVLAVRVLDVQGVAASSYASYGRSEQTQTTPLPAMRGTVYDRDGDVLATSVVREDVVADDLLIHGQAARRQAARQLAGALGERPARLLRQLSRRSGYVVLRRQADRVTIGKVSRLFLPFLYYVPDDLRVDPAGRLLQPILGVVGASGRGLSGLEYLFQPQLAGEAGTERVAVGSGGSALLTTSHVVRKPKQGAGLVLTIDQPLQYEVTRALSAQLVGEQAVGGVAVVMDTKTGAILSMVDLDRQGSKVVPAAQNLATNAVYQPGSVMKLATIAGALQEGLISPGERFTVPDSIWVGGWPFQDAEYHATEEMTASQIVAQSSNVGTIEIARLLGAERLYHFLRDLGFGSRSPLDWPGESAGLLPPPSQWSASSMGTVPIGTGEAVTPMQILEAYNAVANGGRYVPARLVQATVAAGGTEHLVAPAKPHRVLDRSTATALVPMLEGVTTDGTATLAQVPGYQVAGKTGTAQIPRTNGPGYQPGAWMATFVGFAPAKNPQLTAIVVLNRPRQMYGGFASAPVFATIMKYALRHFDVSPSGAGGISQHKLSPSAP
jgi:cell division protein FtsI (penicillin-binding protein 3)